MCIKINNKEWDSIVKDTDKISMMFVELDKNGWTKDITRIEKIREYLLLVEYDKNVW